MAATVSARLKTGSERRFGLSVGLVLGALSGLLWWRGHAPVAVGTAAVSATLILLGLVAPRLLGPVESVWMAFAKQISRVTTPIIMAVVYFLVITPIGLVVRLRGRNPMTPKESDGSFWIPRSAEADRRGAMNNQF